MHSKMCWRRCAVLIASILGTLSGATGAPPQRQNGLVHSDWVTQDPPTAICQASTIAAARDGHLIAAWFGGSREGALDVGIWIAHHNGSSWQTPKMVADGYYEEKRVQYPCWNPVLFQPREGPLMLFYKEGRSPDSWWGLLKQSSDLGHTWTNSRKLPAGIVGPVQNKPVELPNSLILCGSSSQKGGWQVHMEFGRNYGRLWSRTPEIHNAMEVSAIEPTILDWTPNRLQILCRTKQGSVYESWSDDRGKNWSRMVRTMLPNPNSPVDGVVLHDGRALLVYNPSDISREQLHVAVSNNGRVWSDVYVLEDDPGEYTHPAVIQTGDGLIHITYSWQRTRIKHVVLDPALFNSRPAPRLLVP